MENSRLMGDYAEKIDIYNFSLMSFTVELGKQGRSTNLKKYISTDD